MSNPGPPTFRGGSFCSFAERTNEPIHPPKGRVESFVRSANESTRPEGRVESFVRSANDFTRPEGRVESFAERSTRERGARSEVRRPTRPFLRVVRRTFAEPPPNENVTIFCKKIIKIIHFKFQINFFLKFEQLLHYTPNSSAHKKPSF